MYMQEILQGVYAWKSQEFFLYLEKSGNSHGILYYSLGFKKLKKKMNAIYILYCNFLMIKE